YLPVEIHVAEISVLADDAVGIDGVAGSEWPIRCPDEGVVDHGKDGVARALAGCGDDSGGAGIGGGRIPGEDEGADTGEGGEVGAVLRDEIVVVEIEGGTRGDAE